ncbi:MAG: hypothetical protein INR68_11325 [Methylobacterium mesophilicum]|nr:hypothetical protein [Methylobacterium mesophilicum]
MAFGDARKRPLAAHLRKPVAAQPANVVPLKPREEYGVIRTEDDLLVRFAPSEPGMKPQEVSLKDWLDRKELALAVAHYVADWGIGQARTTRSGIAARLKPYLTYLRACDDLNLSPSISVAKVANTVSVDMYVAWLNGALELVNVDGKPLSKNTKAQRYAVVRDMIEF